MTTNIRASLNVLSDEYNFYSYFLSSSLYPYQLSSVYLITFVSRCTLVPTYACLYAPTRERYVREEKDTRR